MLGLVHGLSFIYRPLVYCAAFPVLLCASHLFMYHFVAIWSLVELSANDRVEVSSGSECQLELSGVPCILHGLKSSHG